MSKQKLPYLKYSFIFIGINIAAIIALFVFETLTRISTPSFVGGLLSTMAATVASGMFIKKLNRPMEKKEKRKLTIYMTAQLLVITVILGCLMYFFNGEDFNKVSSGLIAGIVIVAIAFSYAIVAIGVYTGTKAEEKRLTEKNKLDNIVS